MKTYGRRIDDMVIRAPLAMKMALGENPKTTYHGKNQAPVTRMATAAVIREQLLAARAIRTGQGPRRRGSRCGRAEYDAKCEALLRSCGGSCPVHFHAHRLDDIFTAVRLAKEFHLRFAIVHGTEGHRAADILAAEGVRVLCGPLLCDRSKPELRGLTPRTRGFCTRRGWNSPS